MNTAIVLGLYALALAWFGPPLLRRVTGRGVHPRLAVAAWVTTVTAAIAAWVGALAILLIDVLGSIGRHSTLTTCMNVLGIAGQLGLPQAIGSAFALGSLTVGLIATVVVIVRSVHQLRRQRTCSHRHAATAMMIGSPSDQPGVVVISAHEPTAYCVAGRPNAIIVVTTAAFDRLDESQLAAVLAHERAHLTGRHHGLHMLLRAIATSMPRLPLFPAAADAVADLLEMCADDVAVRCHGPVALLSGLLALAGQRSVASSPALGAAGTAVPARAARLSTPASRGIQWRERLALITAIWLAILTPLAAGLACHL